MPRKVLKKTLQAKAKRLGIKGFSTMRKDQLEKAISRKSSSGTSRKTSKRRSMSSGYGKKRPMFARTKPTRMSKRRTLSESVTIDFDANKWLEDTIEDIEERKQESPGTPGSDFLSEICERSVTYYKEQREIIFVISGEPDMTMEFNALEYYDIISNLSDLAYAYLMTFAYERIPSEVFEPFYEDE